MVSVNKSLLSKRCSISWQHRFEWRHQWRQISEAFAETNDPNSSIFARQLITEIVYLQHSFMQILNRRNVCHTG
jgi:hypothetical protein